MGSSLGATISGDRYQVRCFWHYAVEALTDESVISIELESSAAKVVDDVVCRYRRPRPIPRGKSQYENDYFQIKYHVDQSGGFTHEYLVNPTAVSTKESILKRFFGAFERLNGEGAAKLNLVSNWKWHPEDPLAVCFRRSHFDRKFAKKKAAKMALDAWREHLGCETPVFYDFLDRLAIKTMPDLDDLEKWLNDRLIAAGLKAIDFEVEHSPYDDLGLNLIEKGRTSFTPQELKELLASNKLVEKEAETQNGSTILSIRSFQDAIRNTEPAVDIHLSNYFVDKRIPKENITWNCEILQELRDQLSADKMGMLETPISLLVDTHLSIAFAAGKLLPAKSGFPINVSQNVRGTRTVWSSKQQQSECSSLKEQFRGNHESKNLIVCVSVTRRVTDDVLKYAKAEIQDFDLLDLCLEEMSGVGVQDGNHAWKLAEQFSNIVRSHQKKYDTHPLTHVFLAGPVGLAFRIGQESAILGLIQMYEFDFENTHKYSPGIQI